METLRKRNGFTLVELLIAITVLTVIAGVAITIINPAGTRKNTEDAIKQTNIQKLVDGIEAYRLLVGKYPVDDNNDGVPDDTTGMSNYLKGGWLNNEPKGASYSYHSDSTDGVPKRVGTSFGIISPSNKTPVTQFKYRTEWGAIRECPGSAVPDDTGC
jgi:prepilin-type N-terminal cleavage/methylation domain-containing protein